MDSHRSGRLERGVGLTPKTPVIAAGLASVGAGAALTGTIVSACCAGPVLAPVIVSVLGASGAASAAALKPYSPYLFCGSLLLLGFSFWNVYAPAKTCTTGACGSRRNGFMVRSVVWIAAAVWFLSLMGALSTLGKG